MFVMTLLVKHGCINVCVYGNRPYSSQKKLYGIDHEQC